ncbi:hypothetical protein ACKC9G_04380 [Pokkaliibacter sp. CJK22405]|uniref:hypothetical protein n=1 Tax=Pokkaliibacter sp. CJK22405 TaxID=3384615 RepID=UPI003984D360
MRYNDSIQQEIDLALKTARIRRELVSRHWQESKDKSGDFLAQPKVLATSFGTGLVLGLLRPGSKKVVVAAPTETEQPLVAEEQKSSVIGDLGKHVWRFAGPMVTSYALSKLGQIMQGQQPEFFSEGDMAIDDSAPADF